MLKKRGRHQSNIKTQKRQTDIPIAKDKKCSLRNTT